MHQRRLEVSEHKSEKSEMHTVESFCQFALREHIAPKSVGSVKERITKAARGPWLVDLAHQGHLVRRAPNEN